jgi:NADH dehydrogenase
MAGCDAVIHLVGIISEAGSLTFENVHTRLTETMVRAAKQAGVRRFVHMSALGTRANAVARYHQTKWAAEEIVRASELDWTIFRPSIIYGPDDGFVNLFARMARISPVVPLVGGGHSKFQPISVENVARCFVAALMEPQAIGRTFDLCGDEVLTLRQIVDAVLAATERRRWKLPQPFGVANFQAAAAEILFAKLLGRPPPLNRDQLLMLREDNVGDGRDANALFGLKHERFAAGIGRYLKRGS